MASNQPLVDRTEAVYRELRSMKRRFRTGAWITLIVGGLLLLLVAFYFSYGYSEISALKDPELIVSLVGNTVDQQIPIIRQRVESEVKNNAPIWAEQASQQVLAAIPPMREQIEQVVLQQSDEAIAKIDVIGEKQFRRILEENRETVQNAIDQLKNDEEISEDVLQGLQLAIEKELRIDAENQAAAVLTIVSDFNQNMERLHANENLNREQRAERRVLMLARRFQGDLKVDKWTLPDTLKTYLEESEAKRLRTKAIETSAKTGAASDEVDVATAVDEKAAEEEKPAEEPEKEKAAEPKDSEKPAEEDEATDKGEETKEDAGAEKKKPEAAKDTKPEEDSQEASAEEDKPAKESENDKETS